MLDTADKTVFCNLNSRTIAESFKLLLKEKIALNRLFSYNNHYERNENDDYGHSKYEDALKLFSHSNSR